ncbi:MAG: TonB-dependent receptor [Moheibacter sp.]
MQLSQIVLLFLFVGQIACSQYTLNGKITNQYGIPLKEVFISSQNTNIYSNSDGEFQLNIQTTGIHEITFELDGYNFYTTKVKVPIYKKLNIVLEETTVFELEQAEIKHKHSRNIINTETANQDFLTETFSGSLAKSLEKLPGVQAMEIGSATSKPVIRGMGFNRVAILENGIKQESQQWGADHGLDINTFGVEKVEIIKGANTLEFGSDAISGALVIDNNTKPAPYSFSGEFNLIGRSVNQTIGTSLNLRQRTNHFYYKISGNYTNFGDYSIPTDSIIYLSKYIPIHQKKLKNTAGKDYSISMQLGYTDTDFETIFNWSNYYQKVGFFPGSHGEVDLETVTDDGNTRNIDYPFQNVNHFKLSNETLYKFNSNHTLKFLLGYQNNHRQEWSYFHSHYGEEDSNNASNLELDFRLTTYDAQLIYQFKFLNKNKGKIGIQSQNQQNKVNGYSFLLPDFQRYNLGLFFINDFEINKSWSINYGIRYDFTKLNTEEFFDFTLYDFLMQNGYSESDATQNAQRSTTINRKFKNLNYSFGVLFQPNYNWDLNLNLSSSFRIPTAIELASNGIHHGSFRHEKGNPNLDAEKGWTSDFKATFHQKNWMVVFNPYFYYFKNYIFLNPSSVFSPLPNGGQIYKYTQSKAMVLGFETTIKKEFSHRLTGLLSLEYLYNQQLSSNKNERYPLPFTPPMTIFNEWNYQILKDRKVIDNLEVSANFKLALKQNYTARNESSTDGYTIFGIGLKSRFRLKSFHPQLIFNIQNFTNEKYFNHMSFYRALEIPEMGRNFQLILQIPIGN